MGKSLFCWYFSQRISQHSDVMIAQNEVKQAVTVHCEMNLDISSLKCFHQFLIHFTTNHKFTSCCKKSLGISLYSLRNLVVYTMLFNGNSSRAAFKSRPKWWTDCLTAWLKTIYFIVFLFHSTTYQLCIHQSCKTG